MNAEVLNFFFVFMRASALLLVFPVFSGGNFPVQLRVTLAALAAFLILPTLPPARALEPSVWLLIARMLAEGCVGLLLGFISRFVYFAMDLGGTFIAAQIGLVFSPDVDPFTASETQAPGMILYFLGAMILLSLDLHHWLLWAFQRSYTLLPIGGAHLKEALLLDVIGKSSRIFVLAVQLAAPIIAVSFVITLTLGVLGRAIPQINVFAESFAFRSLIGLVVFGLTMSLMAHHIATYLRHMPEDILQVVRLLAAG